MQVDYICTVWVRKGDSVRLKELREAKFMTVADLAKRMGVSAQTIYFWETGRHLPKLSHRKKLVELFGAEVLDNIRG
jgi:DNA-binding XRE family transcriptional regulator